LILIGRTNDESFLLKKTDTDLLKLGEQNELDTQVAPTLNTVC